MHCARVFCIQPSQEEESAQMRTTTFAMLAAATAMIAGCHTNVINSAEFKSALNNYYSGHKECLWRQSMKFPAQADSSSEDQTAQFDALTDAGLLTRTAGEKQRFLIGSKRVNNYDLSDKGRANWTTDAAQPGYGNFCMGTPSVQSIDTYNPKDNPDASQFSVTYHYSVSLPGWADNSEIKTAFSRAANASQGQEASATLVKTQNGWQVQNASDLASSTQP